MHDPQDFTWDGPAFAWAISLPWMALVALLLARKPLLQGKDQSDNSPEAVGEGEESEKAQTGKVSGTK